MTYGFRSFIHGHLVLLVWCCGEAAHHSVRTGRGRVHLMVARTQRGRKGLGSQYPLQEYTFQCPNFYQAPPPMVLPSTGWGPNLPHVRLWGTLYPNHSKYKCPFNLVSITLPWSCLPLYLSKVKPHIDRVISLFVEKLIFFFSCVCF